MKNKVFLLSNAPMVDKDSYRHTTNAIFSALSNPNNKNIGIIGDFGSGKSSAINTFVQENRNIKNLFRRRKIVKVSLAEFYEVEQPNNKNLQMNIIQQILYSVPRRKIPKSKFIVRGFRIGYFVAAFLFFGLILSLLLCHKPNIFSFIPGFAFSDYYWLIPFGLLFLLIVNLLYLFNFKSIKARIDKVELEAQLYNEQQPIDFFLDELIYYFYRTRKNLVIFEDIDRCDDCDKLFSKLRTLNTILNNCSFSKYRKSIVFMHAIKEDVFKEAEQKSKYFDVLLPIKPIFSTNSAYARFCSLLPSAEKDFDSNFCDKICSNFIYLRQMNNVVNAYNMFNCSYNNKLNTCQKQRLISILLFKSLFPEDYINAIKGKGVLCYLRTLETGDFEKSTLASYKENTKYYFKPNPIYSRKIINGVVEKEEKEGLTNFYKIKDFCKFFIKYLSNEAFNLISSFPSNNLSEHDNQYIYSLIADEHLDYVDTVFDDPTLISQSEYFSRYIKREAACNVSVIGELIKHHCLSSLIDEFVSCFDKVTTIRAHFLRNALREIIIEGRAYKEQMLLVLTRILAKFNIVKPLVEIYPNQNMDDLLIALTKVITTHELFGLQNKNGDLIKLLNSSNCSIEILNLFNNDVFYKILENENFKIDSLGSSSQKIDLLNKEKANRFLLSGRYKLNKENLIFISQYYSNNNYSTSIITNISSGNRDVFIKLVELLKKESKTICSLINFYNDEKPDILYTNLNDAASADDIHNMVKSCPILTYDDSVKVKNDYILILFNNNKLKYNLNLLPIIKNIPSIDFEIIKKKVFENVDMIYKRDLNEDSLKILYSLLNDSCCTHEVCGKLLENTINTRSLDCTCVVSNIDSFNVALEFGYFILNDNLIKKVSGETLLNLFKSGLYINEIVKSNNLFVMTEELFRFISKTFNNQNEWIDFVKKYSNFVVENMEKLNDLFDISDLNLLPSKIINSYISNVNVINDELSLFILNHKIDISSKAICCLILNLLKERKSVEFTENSFSNFLYSSVKKSTEISRYSRNGMIKFSKKNK